MIENPDRISEKEESAAALSSCLFRRGDLRAGGALNELGVEQQRTDPNAVHLAGEGVESASAQVLPILADSGQRWDGVAAQGDIIEAQDAHILRHTKSQLLAVNHNAVGQNIMAADNGGTALM